MTQFFNVGAANWISRGILFVFAGGLFVAWAGPALGFTVMRGDAIPKPLIHYFFLGLIGLSLLGFCSSFGREIRHLRITAASILAVSIALWTSVSLIVTGIVQLWLWLLLTVLILSVPFTLVAILFYCRASAPFIHRCWMTCILTILMSLGILCANWHQVRILRYKIPLSADNNWESTRIGLNNFRFDFMLWDLAGRPPHNEHEKAEACREALVRLGYLTCREIPLKTASMHDVLQVVRKARFKDNLWITSESSQQNTLNVCAFIGDIPLWESCVAQAEHQKPKP